MARVKCEICGKGVNTAMGNYIYANGIHQHKKCPTKERKLSNEEKQERKELTDAIKWLAEKQGKPISPYQWGQITKQIKVLIEKGYSCKDQLKAFKYYFDPKRGNEYMGYGIMGWVIEKVLYEYENEKKTQNDLGKIRKIIEEKRRARLRSE